MEAQSLKGKTGLRRIVNATRYSFDGLGAAWRHEAAFRQVAILAAIGLAFAVWLPLPAWGRGLILTAHLLTLVIELFNSAIEAAVDHTSLERHPLAKRAKDLGSAAQFVGLCNLALIWGWVFYSR